MPVFPVSGEIHGRFAQRLAGDGAGVHHHAADLRAAFHDGHALAQLSRLHSRPLPRRPGAYDNKVVIVISHHRPPRSRVWFAPPLVKTGLGRLWRARSGASALAASLPTQILGAMLLLAAKSASSKSLGPLAQTFSMNVIRRIREWMRGILSRKRRNPKSASPGRNQRARARD